MTEKDLRQAEYFKNRIVKNERNLRSWVRRESIEALRLYDKDIPEVPLALDRYGRGDDAALVLALYRRPYEKPQDAENEWLGLMARAASDALGVATGRVFIKTRQHQKGLAQYEKTEVPSVELTVHEDSLSFIVNLSAYLDTGLFLDHRTTRSLVKAASEGKTVLNLFSYTGSFSVYAAAGGAREVWSVDLSNTYLAWAERNLKLNGFSGERFPLVKSDVSDFLANAAGAGKTWDLIIADPPTFSNSKGAQADFDVNRDWPRLVNRCLSVLAPEGRLYFSTNSRELKWESSLVEGTSRDISESTIPPDFRSKKIHRCWLISRR